MGCGQEAAELRAIDKEIAKAKEIDSTPLNIPDYTPSITISGGPCIVGRSADLVNHPPHYTGGKIECIEAITEATKNLNGIEAVCTGNVIKYVWRWKQKNGKQDLEKAMWYLQKLINEVA